MQEILNPKTCISGRVRFFDVIDPVTESSVDGTILPGSWRARGGFQPNLVLYDWATITGKLLTGNGAYKINGIYIEFQNVVDASNPVTPPALSRYDGISYYNSLSSSSNTDFLRVPLTASSLLSDDVTKFPQGNDVNFFAQTAASVGFGIYGKPFNDTAISKIYGAALVAMPVQGDRTQDLVFSRFYLANNAQQAKLVNAQIGLQWSLSLQ